MESGPSGVLETHCDLSSSSGTNFLEIKDLVGSLAGNCFLASVTVFKDDWSFFGDLPNQPDRDILNNSFRLQAAFFYIPPNFVFCAPDSMSQNIYCHLNSGDRRTVS